MADKSEPTCDGDWGFVYVLTNRSMPNVVKVGQTERHPELRAAELSAHSGVPTPFRLEYAWEVRDRHVAERVILDALSEYRVSDAREFFGVTPNEARDLIRRVARELIVTVLRDPTPPAFLVKGSYAPIEYCDRCDRPKSFCECDKP